MESANRKIRDPNYVRMALSGLDELFADQSAIVDVEEVVGSQPNVVASGSKGSAPGTLGAAEFLEHYFGVDPSSWDEDETAPVQTEEAGPVTLGSGIGTPAEPGGSIVEPSHVDITDGARVDLTPLLDRLREAHTQIQSAHYRIGFLEYEIDTYKDKMKLLEDVEARAARAAALERENQELKKLLPLVEARANKVALVKRENDQLQARIRELERRRGGIWSRFLGLFPRD